MGDSNKGFSSKPSTVPKPSDSGAGESNENELSSNQEMGAKMHNPKKPVKHFMSPTISAASKAAVPRKKILGERNEAPPTFSDTHFPKNPNLESRTSSLNSRNSHSGLFSPRVISSYNCASESDDDENNAFVADSCMKSYDPLTNYLSPRPKYLRYKPYRRREVICRIEIESGEERDGIDVKGSDSFDSQKLVDEEVSSADAQDSSTPPLEEGFVKPDDEEIEKKEDCDDEVEEDEEEEVEEFEDGGWSLRGIMKFLLVMFVLFLSTSFILSMNSSTPSYTQQAICNLKDGYNRLQEHLLKDVAVKMFGDGNGSQEQMEASELGAFKVDQRMKEDHEFEEVEGVEVVEDDKEEVMEIVVEQVEMVDPIDGQSEDVLAHQVDDTDEVSDQLKLAEDAKIEDVRDVEVETRQQLSGSGMAEHEEDAVNHELEEMEKAMQGSDLQVQQSRKNCDLFEEIQTQSHSEMVDNHDTPAEEIFEGTIEVGGLVESEIERTEDLISKTGDKTVVSGRMENALRESDTTNSESGVGSMEVKSKKIGSVHTAFIVVVFSTFLTSLVFIYRSKKTRALGEHSQSPQIKPIEKSMLTETLAPVVLSVEEKHIEKKAELFGKPSLLFDPSEETPKETSHVHAPDVVLLGELVVGEVSSSLRGCDRKSKMIESEESNNFAFQEKMFPMSTHAASAPRQLPAVEFSTTDSPSYGSFTAEKKILKKEKGKDAEVKVAVTTPVRRSSRLLNRSVMSP